jgi:hypothetical protein
MPVILGVRVVLCGRTAGGVPTVVVVPPAASQLVSLPLLVSVPVVVSVTVIVVTAVAL